MKHFSLGTCTDRATKDMSYYVHCYQQPFSRWVIAKAYHWYDMRIPIRVPGYRQFEKWLQRIGGENRVHGEWIDSVTGEPEYDHPMTVRDRLRSWTINQDIRCYELSEAGRSNGVFVTVTEDQYRRLGGKSRRCLKRS